MKFSLYLMVAIVFVFLDTFESTGGELIPNPSVRKALQQAYNENHFKGFFLYFRVKTLTAVANTDDFVRGKTAESVREYAKDPVCIAMSVIALVTIDKVFSKVN